MSHDRVEVDPVTLTRFLLSEQSKHAGASGDFTLLMQSVQLACKTIAMAVRKAGIAGLYGLQGSVNVQGEDVKKLDVVANENFINCLKVWAVSDVGSLPHSRLMGSWDASAAGQRGSGNVGSTSHGVIGCHSSLAASASWCLRRMMSPSWWTRKLRVRRKPREG